MITAQPGTYVLVLRCFTTRTVGVGRIGPVRLAPGWYLYVGSAFGPGGLRARIGHHTKRSARPHWHIDYIRQDTHLESVLYRCGVRCEHEWAGEIGARPGATVVLRASGVQIAGARLTCSGSTPFQCTPNPLWQCRVIHFRSASGQAGSPTRLRCDSSSHG
jgi:Uri superfamily endonuclease